MRIPELAITRKLLRLSDFLTSQMSKDSGRSRTINSHKFIMQLVKDRPCQRGNRPTRNEAVKRNLERWVGYLHSVAKCEILAIPHTRSQGKPESPERKFNLPTRDPLEFAFQFSISNLIELYVQYKSGHQTPMPALGLSVIICVVEAIESRRQIRRNTGVLQHKVSDGEAGLKGRHFIANTSTVISTVHTGLMGHLSARLLYLKTFLSHTFMRLACISSLRVLQVSKS